MNETRKIGIGTISFIIFLLGIIFDIQIRKSIGIGDRVLSFFDIKTWSNGNQGIHYTIFYSLILFVISVAVGFKFKNDFGAKTGRRFSLCMIVFIGIVCPLLMINIR